jgi:hypothetical protein
LQITNKNRNRDQRQKGGKQIADQYIEPNPESNQRAGHHFAIQGEKTNGLPALGNTFSCSGEDFRDGNRRPEQAMAVFQQIQNRVGHWLISAQPGDDDVGIQKNVSQYGTS